VLRLGHTAGGILADEGDGEKVSSFNTAGYI
jgi:hypothetical protein